MKICEHTLNYTEVRYKILTLKKHFRTYFPPPNKEINIAYAGNFGKGKMHSSGQTRIDGLGWLYKLNRNLNGGVTITISKEGNDFVIDKDGDNQITSEPVEINEEPNNYEDVTSLSLEKDLEINLMKNLEQLEQGLHSPQSQVPFELGEVRSILDILAKDKDGKIVVIELKAGIATEKVCGQILKYISLVKNQIKDANVRAIIVAHDFEEGLKLAVSSLNNVKLKKYKVNFEFEDVTLNNSGD